MPFITENFRAAFNKPENEVTNLVYVLSEVSIATDEN